MSKRQLILRADDAGSNSSANEGVAKVIKAGMVKNVSLMAVGSKIEEAATLLKDDDSVCFGVHLVLNSEWDRVKWGPLTTLTPESGLVDEEGHFLPNPQFFLETKPEIAVIMAEYDAQYQRLLDLGFKISYADSHMFAENCIPGLQEAVDQWTAEKGLLNHADYYSVPPDVEKLINREIRTLDFLKSVPPGQYFYVIHPAVDSAEMRQTGNASISGQKIATDRDKEATLFSKKMVKLTLKSIGVETIRYDQAIKKPRIDVTSLLL
ncbi:ChbG/HpnK family deacetylase [Vagococcus sp. BWB3-3]|uniref:ChbG/HpnK family deacetylase n=1 Tax=Vagococcus allomyrinae TaxID=2794353 RepID=A0A940SS19_9ENTE|nr:ChbG/HpnK family deacetylase [Vagococcus allomyrinae]MBP1041442.1 ChbG/HpnK family deacetylase [Vagococcus allomyrinae]